VALVPSLVGRSFADIRTEHAIEARGRGGSLQVQRGVGLINISGPIMRTRGLCSDMFEGTTIDEIRTQLRDAVASENVETILLYVDSPGGTVDGVADMADEIYTARQTKPVHAYVDALGASAAYWLATAASHITVSQTGFLGSIGVYATYVPDADAANEVVVVSSGSPRKHLTPDTDDGRAALQEKVDAIYEFFVNAVARQRDLPRATIEETFGQGDVIIAAEAVTRGMADLVGTFDQAVAHARAAMTSTPQALAALAAGGPAGHAARLRYLDTL
jgi:capsid assembly protease